MILLYFQRATHLKLGSAILSYFYDTLKLPIGYSFWAYNISNELHRDAKTFNVEYAGRFGSQYTIPDSGISFFNGISSAICEASDKTLEYLLEGRVDVLHSYGHLGPNDFHRGLAARALSYLNEAGIAVDVWVNHYGSENKQNLGVIWEDQAGDNKGMPFYHGDLTRAYGIKYVWSSHITDCVGQEGRIDFGNAKALIYEFLLDLRYQPFRNRCHTNRLADVVVLDDGTAVFDFVRYPLAMVDHGTGTQKACDAAEQLRQEVVDRLVRNGGYMIYYVHLGANDGPPHCFDENTRKAFERISGYHADGRLWVAPTSKILNYYTVHRYLNWRYAVSGNHVEIVIDSIRNRVEGTYLPTESQLSDITFEIDADHTCSIRVGATMPAYKVIPVTSGVRRTKRIRITAGS